MIFHTKCPHCQTVFRVTEDQLKLYDGTVRCGVCQQVFNASDHIDKSADMSNEQQESSAAGGHAPVPPLDESTLVADLPENRARQGAAETPPPQGRRPASPQKSPERPPDNRPSPARPAAQPKLAVKAKPPPEVAAQNSAQTRNDDDITISLTDEAIAGRSSESNLLFDKLEEEISSITQELDLVSGKRLSPLPDTSQASTPTQTHQPPARPVADANSSSANAEGQGAGNAVNVRRPARDDAPSFVRAPQGQPAPPTLTPQPVPQAPPQPGMQQGQPVPPQPGMQQGQPAPPQPGMQQGQPAPPQPGMQQGQPAPPQPGMQPGQPVPPQPGMQPGQPVPPQPGMQPGQPVPPQPGIQQGQPVPPQPGMQPGQPVPPQPGMQQEQPAPPSFAPDQAHQGSPPFTVHSAQPDLNEMPAPEQSDPWALPSFPPRYFDPDPLNDARDGPRQPEESAKKTNFFSRRQIKKGFLSGRARSFISVGLFALLVLQILYVYSDRMIVWIPASESVVTKVCDLLSCPRSVKSTVSSLSIEANDLQSVAPQTDLYLLTLMVKNNSSSRQSWPHLELTLLDSDKTTLSRRVFSPENYLTDANHISKGIPPYFVNPIRLYLEAIIPPDADYRITLFYP